MRRLLATALAAGIPFAVCAALSAAPSAEAQPAKGAKTEAKKSAGPDLANGKKVYEVSCFVCHGSLAAKKPALPNAGDFFKGEFKFTKGKDDLMEQMIRKGGAGFGKGASPQMPPQPQLKDKDVKDVIAFIKTLGPDAAKKGDAGKKGAGDAKGTKDTKGKK